MAPTGPRREIQRYHCDRRAGSLLIVAANGPHPELMTTPQAADFYGVSVQWLEISRSRGIGPPCVHISPRMVRYRKADQITWLEKRRDLYASGYSEPRRRAHAD